MIILWRFSVSVQSFNQTCGALLLNSASDKLNRFKRPSSVPRAKVTKCMSHVSVFKLDHSLKQRVRHQWFLPCGWGLMSRATISTRGAGKGNLWWLLARPSCEPHVPMTEMQTVQPRAQACHLLLPAQLQKTSEHTNTVHNSLLSLF